MSPESQSVQRDLEHAIAVWVASASLAAPILWLAFPEERVLIFLASHSMLPFLGWLYLAWCLALTVSDWRWHRAAERARVEALVLRLLAEGPAYGLDLRRRAEARGERLPWGGDLYRLMARLEDEGRVVGFDAEPESGEMSVRRRYRLPEEH